MLPSPLVIRLRAAALHGALGSSIDMVGKQYTTCQHGSWPCVPQLLLGGGGGGGTARRPGGRAVRLGPGSKRREQRPRVQQPGRADVRSGLRRLPQREAALHVLAGLQLAERFSAHLNLLFVKCMQWAPLRAEGSGKLHKSDSHAVLAAFAPQSYGSLGFRWNVLCAACNAPNCASCSPSAVPNSVGTCSGCAPGFTFNRGHCYPNLCGGGSVRPGVADKASGPKTMCG